MKFRYLAAAAMMGVMCASAPLHAEPQFNGPGGRGGPNGGPGGGAMHGGQRVAAPARPCTTTAPAVVAPHVVVTTLT